MNEYVIKYRKKGSSTRTQMTISRNTRSMSGGVSLGLTVFYSDASPSFSSFEVGASAISSFDWILAPKRINTAIVGNT